MAQAEEVMAGGTQHVIVNLTRAELLGHPGRHGHQASHRALHSHPAKLLCSGASDLPSLKLTGVLNATGAGWKQ